MTPEEAATIAGEHDSQDTTGYSYSAHRCAKCGVIEPDDGEGGMYADDPPVAILSANLKRCESCDDCVVHPACSPSGICPHCLVLNDAQNYEKSVVHQIVNQIAADLNLVLQLIRTTKNPEKADLDVSILQEARTALDAIISERAAHVLRCQSLTRVP